VTNLYLHRPTPATSVKPKVQVGGKSNPWRHHQPRYVAYCVAHGATTPADMLARDRKKHPAAPLSGFLAWNAHTMRDWCEEKGYRPGWLGWKEHQEYNQWLVERYPTGFEEKK
jgi:hypothetical protein